MTGKLISWHEIIKFVLQLFADFVGEKLQNEFKGKATSSGEQT